MLFLELVVIIYLSLKSPNGGVKVQMNDKIGHFIGYGVLSLNTFLVYGFQSLRKTLGLLLGLLGLGALMEFLQGFVPQREVSGLDMLANATGVLLGTLGYWSHKKFQSSKKRS